MNLFICYDRCSTCKKAEKWLNEKGIDFEKRRIREENPTEDELRKWIKVSGLAIKNFFNTNGSVYKDLNLKEKLPVMNEEEQIKLLASNGMLVKRPIFVSEDGNVLVGFKENDWKILI